MEEESYFSQSLALTHDASPLDSGEPDHGEWQKVRLMPALLRIFTRVNLLAFVGENQGIEISAALPCIVLD